MFPFFEYGFLLEGFFSFSVVFVGGALCVYPFITFVSCFDYFGCAGSLGVSLAGRVIYFPLCGAPLCGVSVRYNLFECWPGLSGGAVRVFSWALLGWVRYD